MKRAILILMLAALLFSDNSFAAELSGVPSSVRTPEDVAKWFSSDFKYQMTVPDRPQMPQEMLDSKKGDCDDFACLASAILTRSGIENNVVMIKFKDLRIMHAVCLSKDKNGMYCVISNASIIYTGTPDITEAMAKVFPDWQELIMSNLNREYLTIIKRR